MIYLADPQREKRREVMRGKAKEKPTQTSVVANRNGDISMSDTTLNASQDDDDLTDYWDEVATVSREKDVDALEALRHVEEQHEKHLIIVSRISKKKWHMLTCIPSAQSSGTECHVSDDKSAMQCTSDVHWRLSASDKLP